jgi:hypothetical protein
VAERPLITYRLKHYRRTKRGGSVGELTKTINISAPGFSAAEEIVAPQLAEVDFETDFAILEGDTDFVKVWLTGHEEA